MMPHISVSSSAVDQAAQLTLAVLGRAKPPARELGRKARENLAIRQPLFMQSSMAAAHELLRPLVEERQHYVDQPNRLGPAQPRRAHQIGDEIREFRWLQHGRQSLSR